MDHTSRMVELLGRMRRERNGAVADAMRVCGKPYGLNYGVSLPTLRRLARAEGEDHAFARFLYEQDVRELRLAALHVAEPACVKAAEFDFWAAGIVNSEVAEEVAFALLCRSESLAELFPRWLAHPAPLMQYAALMAGARAARCPAAWIAPTVEAVHRNAADPSLPAWAARLTAQGAVALLAACGAQNEENRQTVIRAAGSLGKLPAEDYVHEELAWRLEA